jgi:hypothetical protein
MDAHFPGYTMDILDIFAAGDRGICRWVMRRCRKWRGRRCRRSREGFSRSLAWPEDVARA